MLPPNKHQFLVQSYAGLHYIEHHHPYADILGQPSQAPLTVSASDPELVPDTKANETTALTNGNTATNSSNTQQPPPKEEDQPDEPSDKPHSHEEFAASLRELAQGLVLKEQQIEYLIQSLPGIGSSEQDQERRIRELQEELRVVEKERREKEVVRENLVEGLGKVLVGGRRVP